MIESLDLYVGILIIIISILIMIVIVDHTIYSRIFRRTFLGIKNFKGKMVHKEKKEIELGNDTIDKIIRAAGYAYDVRQDIFYSTMDAWQRDMGFCRLYDEAAAPMGMIIDCEPIYFEYDNKRWLIEFWKGQYDLVTGAEIGVYVTDGPDLDIPGYFNGTFYKSVSDTDLLKMSFLLMKNNKVLVRRRDTHWWLTGFKLGEFSEPFDLVMKLSVTLKDKAMRNAFIKGLQEAGYGRKKIRVFGNSVSIVFDKPYTSQPITRTEKTDWVIQRKNQFLCEAYQEITRPFNTLPDKINAVIDQSPEIYQHIINLGRTKELYEKFEKISKYL